MKYQGGTPKVQRYTAYKRNISQFTENKKKNLSLRRIQKTGVLGHIFYHTTLTPKI